MIYYILSVFPQKGGNMALPHSLVYTEKQIDY